MRISSAGTVWPDNPERPETSWTEEPDVQYGISSAKKRMTDQSAFVAKNKSGGNDGRFRPAKR